MARPRGSLRQESRLAVSEAETLWARGELTEEHPDYAEVIFFTPPDRLRAVWGEVNGETWGKWLLRHPDRWHCGGILIHLAAVGHLNAEDIRLLGLGIAPGERRDFTDDEGQA